MKKTVVLLSMAMLLLAGCQDSDKAAQSSEDSPVFLAGCFRKEVVSETFRIPQMSSFDEASYLRQRIAVIPGYLDSTVDLQNHTITINYKSSTVRKMNFEEAIAMAGYAVNNRPAGLQKNNLPEKQ